MVEIWLDASQGGTVTELPVILASDFGPMVRDVAAIVAFAVVLGIVTASIAVKSARDKSLWWFSPLFALLWLGLIALLLYLVFGRIPI